MPSNTSLLGRALLWIAYGSTSKLESWTKSLTRIRVLRVFRGFFGGLLRKKSLGEIFLKKLLTQEIICNSGRQQIKSLRKSQLKMRSSSSLLGRGLFWIAYGSTSKLESWIKSLTKMKSEVWSLRSEVWWSGLCHPTKILKIISNL